MINDYTTKTSDPINSLILKNQNKPNIVQQLTFPNKHRLYDVST